MIDENLLKEIDDFYSKLESYEYKRPEDYIERYIKVVLNNDYNPAHIGDFK